MKTILEDMARDSSKIKHLYHRIPEDLPFLSFATLRSVIPKLIDCPLPLLSRVVKMYDASLRYLQRKFQYQQKRQTQKALLRLRMELTRDSFHFYKEQDWHMKRIHKYVMKKVNKAVRPSLSKPDKLRLAKIMRIKKL